MKTLLLILLILQFAVCNLQFAVSQNLVPNPSFEEYSPCPNGQCQVIYATGWDSYSYSPDYFNACSANFSVPQNPFGYQPAATGDAYVGMFCFGNNSTVREYIGSELLAPLQIGQKYKVEFKTVLANNPSFGANCAINNLGVLFTTVSYAMGNPCMHIPILLPQNHAHIFASNFISDTTSWTVISSEFIADSSYQYIVIGNFFDNAHTNDSIFNTGTCDAYYYIDDVSVEIDTTTSIPVIQNKSAVSINVFPNPANSFIKISLPEKTIYNIELLKLIGNTVYKNQTTGFADVFIDINVLPNGLYIIKIYSDKNQYIQKLIINH